MASIQSQAFVTIRRVSWAATEQDAREEVGSSNGPTVRERRPGYLLTGTGKSSIFAKPGIHDSRGGKDGKFAPREKNPPFH